MLCNQYVPNPPPQQHSSSTAGTREDVLNVTTQLHLQGTAHSMAVLALGNSTYGTYVTAVSPVSVDKTTAGAWATSQVQHAKAVGIEALRKAHRDWWHSFWPAGGFVTYEYTVLESLYYLMQYKFGSAARRGRAFMDLNGPWLVTNTNAPDVHWDWNIQGMYYMPFLTNRPEIANSLVDYMEGLLRTGVLWSASNVLKGWEDSAAAPGGAAVPIFALYLYLHAAVLALCVHAVFICVHSIRVFDHIPVFLRVCAFVCVGVGFSARAVSCDHVAGASSLTGEQTCYWNYGPNCTASPPSVTGNLLWTLHVVHQSGAYQANHTVATDVVWPLLVRAVRFYTHFMIENTTHISLPPTFSPEYPGAPGPNANYDLALLRWGVQTAIQLAGQYTLVAPGVWMV